MKGKFRMLAAGAAALAAIGAGVLAGIGPAVASGGGGPVPPWQSAAQGNIAGSITFYNAQGQVVTGGSTTAHGLALYAVASAAGPAGYTKATLFLYTPTLANPGTWSSNAISASTSFVRRRYAESVLLFHSIVPLSEVSSRARGTDIVVFPNVPISSRSR